MESFNPFTIYLIFITVLNMFFFFIRFIMKLYIRSLHILLQNILSSFRDFQFAFFIQIDIIHSERVRFSEPPKPVNSIDSYRSINTDRSRQQKYYVNSILHNSAIDRYYPIDTPIDISIPTLFFSSVLLST